MKGCALNALVSLVGLSVAVVTVGAARSIVQQLATSVRRRAVGALVAAVLLGAVVAAFLNTQ